MFLQKLNDSLKLSFLAIADELVKADGFLAEEEVSLMDSYAQELGCKRVGVSSDLDGEISNIATVATADEKRVVLLELLALAKADARFAEEEESLLNKVASAFEIHKEEYSLCIELLDQYMTSYSALVNFVDGGL